MATTVDDCFSSIYIIRIPIEVKINGGEFSASHSVIQIGKAGGSVSGLRQRMLQHLRSWLMATGVYPKISNNTEGKTPLSLYTCAELISTNSLQDLIGLIVKEKDEENEDECEDDGDKSGEVGDAILDVEDFIRGIVGVKLRRSVIKTLLSKPCEHFHETVYAKGTTGFSDTELRIVHNEELTILRNIFSSKWEKNEIVGVGYFVEEMSKYHRALIPNVTFTLRANYSDAPPSKKNRGNRLTVTEVGVTALSYLTLVVRDDTEDSSVDMITRGVRKVRMVDDV